MPAPLGWRVVAASVEGTSHQQDGRPCQDAHAFRVLDDGVVVLVVADGAGSAARAEVGACTAVAVVVDTVADILAVRTPTSDDGWRQLVAGALVAARIALEAEAIDDDVAALATTLAVTVVTPEALACGQVGDAAVVVSRAGVLATVGQPPSGEYLNETTFVTSSRWADEARIDVSDADGIDGVAILSDGLQLLALDLAQRAPHPPFFEPLYRFAASDDASDDELAAFLASERVCARTDDDKTLVLAVRA